MNRAERRARDRAAARGKRLPANTEEFMRAHNSPAAALSPEQLEALVQRVDAAARPMAWVIQAADDFDPASGGIKNTTTLHVVAVTPEEALEIAIGLTPDSPYHHVLEGIDLELMRLRAAH